MSKSLWIYDWISNTGRRYSFGTESFSCCGCVFGVVVFLVVTFALGAFCWLFNLDFPTVLISPLTFLAWLLEMFDKFLYFITGQEQPEFYTPEQTPKEIRTNEFLAHAAIIVIVVGICWVAYKLYKNKRR